MGIAVPRRSRRPRLHTRILAVASLLAFVGCGGTESAWSAERTLPSATTLPAPVLAESEYPVIFLYRDGRRAHVPPGVPREVEVELAAWSDGRLVWRADGILRQARIDASQIDELIQRLHREGVFGDGQVRVDVFGLCSGFDVVAVRLEDRELRLRSWHEGFEQNPGLVVTTGGVVPLDGRDRAAVLAAEPAEFLRFRRIWSDVRSTAMAWIPAESEPFEGSLPAPRD